MRSPPAFAASRQVMTADEVSKITAPALVAVGTKDDVAGPADRARRADADARALDIPGRDHMLAVGDKVFKSGVLQFLDERA